ncbi:hypothetical protein LE058_17185 [Escherichia coli]|uniref:hypothetical protein n=1 Tax=Escherichia coli TaxID=562 RepID=UPI000DD85529|nr:hypothetical protein [Escherichia coli]MCA7282745.1 hypothetical protein [Escherichia coli]
MSQEKAKYRILRLSFIGNQLLDEGTEVEYDGEPGSALEPINDAAKAAKKKAEKKHGNPAAEEQASVPSVVTSEGDNDANTFSENEASLRQQYEELFNKKPGNMSVETIKERIAEERAKLGV